MCFYLTVFVTVSSGEIRMGGQEHFYMETQSMLVVPVGEETEFNVYVSTQWPTLTQVQTYSDLKIVPFECQFRHDVNALHNILLVH